MLTDIRQITVQEFHQMFKAGILDDDEHVELIAGQIIKMAAKGTPHRATVTRIWKLLETRLGDAVDFIGNKRVDLESVISYLHPRLKQLPSDVD